MEEKSNQTIIKKYANRRLYNTNTSSYVTLDNLGDMVHQGVEFVVHDAKTGNDLTRSVLAQIIFEQEGKTDNALLPISFLRQLISFYGNQMQAVVPSYLELSITALTQQQDSFKPHCINWVDKDNDRQASIQLAKKHIQCNTEEFKQSLLTPKSSDNIEKKPLKEADIYKLNALKIQINSLQNQLY